MTSSTDDMSFIRSKDIMELVSKSAKFHEKEVKGNKKKNIYQDK